MRIAAGKRAKGEWWSLQPFPDDRPSPFAEGSPNRIEPLTMYGGTDILLSAAEAANQGGNWPR